MTIRAAIGVVNTTAAAVAQAFAAGLQAGHDQRDAEMLNRQFAADIIWGGPYGALVEGHERLHPIHLRFQQQPPTGAEFHYRVRHVLAVSDDVIVTHIARLGISPDGKQLPPGFDPDQPFSEMAMYVLVRRDGHWWVAAGQNTPLRPGGAAPADS